MYFWRIIISSLILPRIPLIENIKCWRTTHLVPQNKAVPASKCFCRNQIFRLILKWKICCLYFVFQPIFFECLFKFKFFGSFINARLYSQSVISSSNVSKLLWFVCFSFFFIRVIVPVMLFLQAGICKLVNVICIACWIMKETLNLTLHLILRTCLKSVTLKSDRQI